MKRLRVAWFSDLRQMNSGSASLSSYTTKLILPLLSESFDIEVFSSEGTVSPKASHFLTAFRRHLEFPFDLFFYQFEDNLYANFVRAHLGLVPGLVWFHDFFLTSDGPEPLLNSPWEEITAKFNSPLRSWPDRNREYKRPKPQAYREAALAFGPVFSSERDHDEYKRTISLRLEHGGQKSWYLPVPIELPAAQSPQVDETVVAYCGTPRIEHRAHKVLQALSDAHRPWKILWLLNEDEKPQAQELLNEFGCSEFEIISPRTPEQWAKMLPRATFVILSHFSVYGHLNPYLPIALATGIPCLVTDFSSGALLPEEVVLKVQPGETEAREITMLLNRFEHCGGYGRVERAATYAREFHDPKTVASELRMVFEESAAHLGESSRRWSRLEKDARDAILREVMSESGKGLFEESFRELGWIME